MFHAQGQGSSERITALEVQINIYKETLVQKDTLLLQSSRKAEEVSPLCFTLH